MYNGSSAVVIFCLRVGNVQLFMKMREVVICDFVVVVRPLRLFGRRNVAIDVVIQRKIIIE